MTEIGGAAAAAHILVGDTRPSTHVEEAEAHGECANCDTHLQGAYCHACGQKAHLHTRLRHLAGEFVEGIAHFDGRLWRTLPLLAFRPGTLSRRWREGKRVRYVAPLHVFLFGIFLLFVIPSFTGRHLINIPEGAGADFKIESGGVDAVVLDMEQDPARAAEAQARIADARRRAGGALSTTRQAAGAAPDQPTEFERGFMEKVKKVFEQREYYSYKIESLAYKLSFVVVPITMAILWVLLLFKRGYTLYDHAVVALYGIGVFAVMIAVALALPGRAANWAVNALLVLAPLHAVVHLKGAYALSWPGALIRGVFLGFFTSIAFGVFLLSVILLGVFT